MRPQRHHILFERVQWCASQPTKGLRNMQTLIPKLDPEVHQDLHRAVTHVPVPDRYMAARVYREYTPQIGILACMDNLIQGFDRASRHPKTNRLDQELGQLIVASIEAQKPFILDGVYCAD